MGLENEAELSVCVPKKHKRPFAIATLSKWIRKYWTIADVALENWTFADTTPAIDSNETRPGTLADRKRDCASILSRAAPNQSVEGVVRKRPYLTSTRAIIG